MDQAHVFMRGGRGRGGCGRGSGGRGGRGDVFPDGPNWSVNCAGCGAAPPEGGRHSKRCSLCPSTYFCGREKCPGFVRHEAWHSENEENDGQLADRKENSSCQQANRKIAEQQARSAEKTGSEYMRLLADATRNLAEENNRPAEAAFRKAIALNPRQPSAYFNLGILCSNERRSVDAAHNFLDASTRFSEGSADWASSTAMAFDHLLSPECKEVAKPEWWNDESLKALSKTVARVAGAESGYQCRLNGHLMRMNVLSGQIPGWKLGPRSAEDLSEAATHAGLAAQLFFPRESAQATSFALELLKTSADLFHKAADREVIEAKIKVAQAGAKAKTKAKTKAAEAVVRAEAETKANLAADALLAEEAAEAVAAATSAPSKGKGWSKGKGKRSGKQ